MYEHGIGRAMSAECNKIELESLRSGCQMTDVLAEVGLENAGVMTSMRLCEAGWRRLYKGRSERLWGRPLPSSGTE